MCCQFLLLPPSNHLNPQMSQNCVQYCSRHRPFYCASSRGAKTPIHLHCTPANEGFAKVHLEGAREVKFPKNNICYMDSWSFLQK